MHRFLPILILILPLAAARADTRTVETEAPSSIVVEMKGDDWIVHQRAVRFYPYTLAPEDITVGVRFAPRLATIVATADGPLDDQAHRIEVMVDDMDGPALRRIARFSDPGTDGHVVGDRYFITTEPGCCERPALHHVRALETGTWLFDSSGGFEAGMAAWMDVPNHHPTLERWAAFEAAAADGSDKSLLGTLRYGDRNGAITGVTLHMDPARQPRDIQSDLPTCGALVWREPGKDPGPGQARRPAPGTCYEGGTYTPASLFSLEHKTGPLGGFELELSLFGKVYGTIPVTDDRLDVVHARLEPGLHLVPARR